MSEWLEYPCPTCDAEPGEPCITTGGRPATRPHIGRRAMGRWCLICEEPLPEDEQGSHLCARCRLVRALEVERATKHIRVT